MNSKYGKDELQAQKELESRAMSKGDDLLSPLDTAELGNIN